MAGLPFDAMQHEFSRYAQEFPCVPDRISYEVNDYLYSPPQFVENVFNVHKSSKVRVPSARSLAR